MPCVWVGGGGGGVSQYSCFVSGSGWIRTHVLVITMQTLTATHKYLTCYSILFSFQIFNMYFRDIDAGKSLAEF